MLVGAIFGSGASGPMSDRLGRRRVVFIVAIVYIVGALILAFPITKRPNTSIGIEGANAKINAPTI